MEMGKIKANCTITFEDCIKISGFKVMENKEGHLFLSMPNVKGNNGKFYELAQFTNREFRQYVGKWAVKKYQEALKNKDDFSLPGGEI